jgi:hypothetical protein
MVAFFAPSFMVPWGAMKFVKGGVMAGFVIILVTLAGDLAAETFSTGPAFRRHSRIYPHSLRLRMPRFHSRVDSRRDAGAIRFIESGARGGVPAIS